MSALDPVLAPASIALIGASDDPVKISGRPLAHLLRFGFPKERLHPVNARRGTVQGLPAYPPPADLPEPPDLAIVTVPAADTPGAVRACAAAGARAAMVFAAGFAETGPDGAALQDQLAATAAETGIRLLGPNCLGAVNLHSGTTPTFTSALEGVDLLPGSVALVTQSGAFGSFLLSAALGSQLGIAHFVNTGNEVDLTVSEAAEDLLERDEVTAVLIYAEQIRDADRFTAAAERARDLGKAIAAVKVGRSAQGTRAAASHTAAIAGDDLVYDGVLAQHRVVRTHGMEPLIDTGRILAPGRAAAGPRVSIVTISGGGGILMADLCADLDLEVPVWEGSWRQRMEDAIPGYGSAANPIDVTATAIADTSMLDGVLRLCADHPGTDIVHLLMGAVTNGEDDVIATVARVAAHTPKPVVVTWVGGSGRPARELARRGVPVFSDPGRAVRATAALAGLGEWTTPRRPAARTHRAVPAADPVRRQSARLLLDRARRRGQGGALDEHEAKQLLALYGVPVADERPVATPDDAAAAASALGGHVAVKLLSHRLAHKTELGGVRLGLEGAGAVQDAAAELLGRARGSGHPDARLLVQRMAPPGAELMAGIKHDPVFGPVLLLAHGGTLAELVGEGVVARPPLDLDGARALIGRLPLNAVLGPVRGRPAADTGALARALAGIAALAAEVGDDLAELDVNPLIAGPHGTAAVDAYAAPST
ncbi:acetate--CoA ligase family protein [Nocardiopsis coralliicola]